MAVQRHSRMSITEALREAGTIGPRSAMAKIARTLRSAGNGTLCDSLLSRKGLAPVRAWLKMGVAFDDLVAALASRALMGRPPQSIHTWSYFMAILAERYPDLPLHEAFAVEKARDGAAAT